MTTDRIAEARQIIGKNEEKDYILKPKMYAELFSEQAPALSDLLKSSQLEGIAEKYSQHNGKAIAAQAKYKAWMKKARLWVLLTACCSAALLAVATWLVQPDEADLAKMLFIVISIAAFVSSFIATTYIKLVENLSLLKKWMGSRANAEMQRLSYFEGFVKRSCPQDAGVDPIFLRLLQLEFFRRFQLDMQVSYYTRRGGKHAVAAEKSAAISTWAMGIAGLAAAIAGFLGASIDPRWAALAAVGFVFQAHASNTLSAEAVNQDRRNEERYGRTLKNLQDLKADMDRVRQQVTDGNPEILPTYVDAVHEQLSLEHRQWIEDTETTSQVLGELKAQLKKVQPEATVRKDN